jgi:hypothetical protein
MIQQLVLDYVRQIISPFDTSNRYLIRRVSNRSDGFTFVKLATAEADLRFVEVTCVTTRLVMRV